MGIKGNKERGQGLGELILQTGRIGSSIFTGAVGLAYIVEECLLQIKQALVVEGLDLDSVVDDFEGDESDDFGGIRSPRKEGKADLPGLGVVP